MVRFGVFEFDPSTGELRKLGIRVRLQAKPRQILEALLENPAAAVSREELRRRLWPEDTFVDFERGLNSAMNRLRITLGDAADNPRFIETVARTGYRFLAPVSTPQVELPVAIPPPRRMNWALVAGIAATVLAAAGYAVLRPSQRPQVEFRQITFQRGTMGGARFASDHNILYAAKWEAGPAGLYLTSSRSPESRFLDFRGLSLGSVSSTGELALFKSGEP